MKQTTFTYNLSAFAAKNLYSTLTYKHFAFNPCPSVLICGELCILYSSLSAPGMRGKMERAGVRITVNP